MIQSKEIKLVDLKDIKLNPKNRNTHSGEQIERLCKLISYQGFRIPVVVSNLSGLLVSGEGRYLAATKMGMKQIPVIYQDFESEEQEYAFGVSDNAIHEWSFLDFGGINDDIGDLGPDFDIEQLGLKDFKLDMSDKIQEINRGDENSEWVDMPEFKEGDGYIRLMLQFGSEQERLEYSEKNNLSIARKMKSVWIVNL